MRLPVLTSIAISMLFSAAACFGPVGSTGRSRLGELCAVDSDCNTDTFETCGYRLGDGCAVKGLCVAPISSCPSRVDVELCLCDGTNFAFSCVADGRPAPKPVRSSGRCGASLDGGSGDGASDATFD